MFLVISHEPFELQKRILPFRKGFFIINNFVNRYKALRPFFIAVIALQACKRYSKTSNVAKGLLKGSKNILLKKCQKYITDLLFHDKSVH